MAHGAGVGATAALLRRVFYPRLGNPGLDARLDAGIVACDEVPRLAVTTDSYVVTPLRFPGGSIGDLAVCGSLNDLAMTAARPLALTLAFILEEGFLISDLETVVDDIARRATESGVPVVAGDTKVVERGKVDGLFITASAVGVPVCADIPAPGRLRCGDLIILSGDVGRHAIAVQAARQGFLLDPPVESDVALLWPVVDALVRADIQPRCLRDLTRGGLGMALLEIARDSGLSLELSLDAPPLLPGVTAVVGALGLDPFFLANEGRFIAVVAPDQVDAALEVMRGTRQASAAQVIGVVAEGSAGSVVLRTPYGTRRRLSMPASEPLPRIC
jgi:hydrogenase expression/formation protein HypE